MTCQVVNSEVVVGLMTVAYAFSILERTATRGGGLFNCLFFFRSPLCLICLRVIRAPSGQVAMSGPNAP